MFGAESVGDRRVACEESWNVSVHGEDHLYGLVGGVCAKMVSEEIELEIRFFFLHARQPKRPSLDTLGGPFCR